MPFIKRNVDELPGNPNIVYEVLNYREHYFSVPKKKVIYTCITGGYDNLIQHSYIDFNYDYICFTDNDKLLNLGTYGTWKIRPLHFFDLIIREIADGIKHIPIFYFKTMKKVYGLIAI